MKLTQEQVDKASFQLKNLEPRIKLHWMLGCKKGQVCHYFVSDTGDIVTQQAVLGHAMTHEKYYLLETSPTPADVWANSEYAAEDMFYDLDGNLAEEGEKLVFTADGKIDWLSSIERLSMMELNSLFDDYNPLQTMLLKLHLLAPPYPRPFTEEEKEEALKIDDKDTVFIQYGDGTCHIKKEPVTSFILGEGQSIGLHRFKIVIARRCWL